MKLHQKLFWLLILLLPVQLGRHLWPEWAYVLGLQVDYLAPTIYLTDLLVVGTLVSWWWEIRDTKYVIRNTLKRYWWVIAVFIYLLTNSFLAQNPGAALYKFIKITEFALLGLYIARTKPNVSRITSCLSLAVVYSSLIALVQFIKQASLNGVFWWLGERTFVVATPGIARAVVGGRLLMRPYATFPHPNVLAGFLVISLILIGVKSRESGVKRILQWAAMVLGIAAIAISFSRSVWLVGMLGLLSIAYYLLSNKKRRRNIIFGLIFLGLIGVFYFAPQLSTEKTINQRVQLIKVAIQMIRTAPVVGVGLNNFIVRLPDFWTVQSIYWLQPVHNIFLLVAAEIGLAGLLVFLWFLYLTIARAYRGQKFIILYSLFVILFLGLFDHYWFTLQQAQLLFSLIIGLSWRQ